MSSPGVRFPPPLLFVAGFAAGWVIEQLVLPFPFTRRHDVWLMSSGVTVMIAGAALALWGVVTFRAARTAILPFHSASRIVTSGPYRFTRNPMYTGFTLAHVGSALAVNSIWPVLLLPIVIALLVRFVIHREEAYLRRAFGEEYEAYCTRVRRWL